MSGATDLRAAVDAMFSVAPVQWWRFVPCPYCRSMRNEQCVMGGDSWPQPARAVHAERMHDARLLHGTLWLLDRHPEDVLGPDALALVAALPTNGADHG